MEASLPQLIPLSSDLLYGQIRGLLRARILDGSHPPHSRVRLPNREPVSLEVTYLPEAVGRQLKSHGLVTRDIFLILENDCALAQVQADLGIDAVLADDDLAEALRVEDEFLDFRGDAFQYRLRTDRQRSAAGEPGTRA